jgi:hypothetical protein
MNQFFPLFGFKKIAPTRWYKAKYGSARQLEAFHTEQENDLKDFNEGRMLAQESDKKMMKDDFLKLTSLDEVKNTICQAVANDSEINKGAFETIKLWYQLQARNVYYKTNNELKPVAYFDMSCFVNPHNEIRTDTSHFSAVEMLAYEEDKQFGDDFIVNIYDLGSVLNLDEYENVTEVEDDGSRWDNSSGSGSFPTYQNTEKALTDEELLAISENAF